MDSGLEGVRRWVPLAVAVMGVTCCGGERGSREARLDAVLFGYRVGYFVLDVVDVTTGADAGFRWMEELARRTDADAFVVLGECDTERLEVLADRLRLVVRYAAPR